MVAQNAKLVSMRNDARAIFQAGLAAADPSAAVLRHCHRRKDRLLVGEHEYHLAAIDRILVVGAGKATAPMAAAMERLLGDRISGGLISVKHGHALPLTHIETIESGHPIPDQNGWRAARRILSMVTAAGASDLVFTLLSGGGSALLPLADDPIRLADKQAVSDLLIAAGATIHEINTIRKHLSAIKGGRLAQAAAPAAMVTLILSDVVGNDMDVIASGPTVPDDSTFAQCQDIIARYGLAPRLPQAVANRLRDGMRGRIPETPDRQRFDWRHVHNLIVADNRQSVLAAANEARRRGYRPLILSTLLQGETRVVAKVHAAIAGEVLASGHPIGAPACLLSGGETTVTVRGGGRGGRNQEFALAAAMDIHGLEEIVILSGGTDGTDGPTDAAGGLVDHATLARARAAGLDARHALEDNDAYPFLKRVGDLLVTGPTLTNVMDLHIVLICSPEHH